MQPHRLVQPPARRELLPPPRRAGQRPRARGGGRLPPCRDLRSVGQKVSLPRSPGTRRRHALPAALSVHRKPLLRRSPQAPPRGLLSWPLEARRNPASVLPRRRSCSGQDPWARECPLEPGRLAWRTACSTARRGRSRCATAPASQPTWACHCQVARAALLLSLYHDRLAGVVALGVARALLRGSRGFPPREAPLHRPGSDGPLDLRRHVPRLPRLVKPG